ncbi:MAG: right-handed parallel beta-helix repeat-containing protein [Phycisphaerales bacterium]
MAALAQGAPLNVWIGGSQATGACEPGCGWTWVSGEPWSYTNWASGEPNNQGDEAGLEFYASGPVGQWNDKTTGEAKQYILEWDADCNGDGIVDYGQIVSGELLDANGNGVPDCCEQGQPRASLLLVPQQYNTISGAILAAHDGDTILVSPGTYIDHLQLNGKRVSIVGASDGDVVIDGSFIAGTILTISGGQGPETLIKGITFRSGVGSPLPQAPQFIVAGALLVNEASPRIENCTFESNTAQFGGGIYARKSAATLKSCNFYGNLATQDGGGLQGLNSALSITDCTFGGNRADVHGGATHFSTSSPPLGDTIIHGCTFTSNQASDGGALTCWAGDALAKLVITDSTFTQNTATLPASGAGAMWVAPWVPNVLELSNVSICGNSSPQLVCANYLTGGSVDICTCAADLTLDGAVDGADLGFLLAMWGPVNPSFPQADINGDGQVNGADLALLLSAWGPCS